MSALHSPALELEFQRLNRLRFSPRLETKFAAYGLEHRQRVGRVMLIGGIVVYDAFLFADWQNVPDMIGWLTLARLGVFTPVCILILCALPRTKTIGQIDMMASATTVLAVLMPMTASVFSVSPYVLVYQFGSLLTLTFFTVVQRVQFRWAAICLVLAVAIQLVCVALRPDIDSASFLFVVNFYLAGALLLLMGCFTLERAERKAFLEAMRSEFLIEHIERTARTDLLTGLSNRHHLASIADELARNPLPCGMAALMIDIDHFKSFNDTQGHLGGDRCIRKVAEIVREALERPGLDDALVGHGFRFGGEEFLILVPGCDRARAAALGETIRRRLGAAGLPHPAMGEAARVTASIGVAVSPGPTVSLDAVIGEADAALYRAKREGRDRLCLAA